MIYRPLNPGVCVVRAFARTNIKKTSKKGTHYYMRKIDSFFRKFQNDAELRESFADAFATGNLIFFFKENGLDPKLSEFSEFLTQIQENDKEYFQSLVYENSYDPALEMPEEQWNEMISPFQEDSVPPPEILINYNSKFKDSTPILYRNDIIRQILSCLILQYKSNVLLVGPAGVGKTRIVEELACQLAGNYPMIPPQLKDYTIWELPLSGIIAGSGLVGDTEKKAKAVIDFASNRSNKVILFIDEAHMLVRGDRSYDTIAQMFKPALARGLIKVICATTTQEANSFMTDPAFNRRFNKIVVDELSKEQTYTALWEMKEELSAHYNGMVYLSKNAITEAIDAADTYKIAGSHRPDNVITLLDRAMADMYMSTYGNIKNPIRLTGKHVKNTALKLASGKMIDTNIDIDALRSALSVIKGQDYVIERIIDIIKRDSLNLFPRSKPLSLLLAGNTGTGKSLTARILGLEITGNPPITLNMTEFSEKSSLSRIVGVHAGYSGYDSKAELPFDVLENNPRQLILLDEYEKGNTAVKRLFLNVFDTGTLQLANNKTVDFSRTIIIATTNAGFNHAQESIGFTTDDSQKVASVKDLSHCFDVELLNRFSSILYYNPITEQVYRDIVKSKYDREVKEIKSHGKAGDTLPDTLSEDELDRLVQENYNPAFGARHVQQIVRMYIENILFEPDSRVD